MAIVKKTRVKNFNAGLLAQQVLAAPLPLTGIGWAGFASGENGRIYAPAATRRVVGRRSGSDGEILDFADPGELRLGFSRDLTAPEDTTLDGLLTAHDSTGVTSDQTRDDQDETELDLLTTAFRNWNTLTDVQRSNATRLAIRYIVRQARSQDI